MKRIFPLLLAVVLILSFCACGENNGDKNAPKDEITESAEKVEITVSAFDLEDKDAFVSEMENYGAEVSEENGNITLAFSKPDYDTLLSEKKAAVIEVFEATEKDENSYIEKIEYDEELKNLKFYVDREAYKSNSSDITQYTVSAQAMVYQMYLGDELKTNVTIIYSDTNEEAYSFTVPVSV